MRYLIDTYGNVDLGTLDWNISGSNFYAYYISNNIKKPEDDNTTANIYCNLYRAVPLNVSFVEGDMALSTNGYLYIRDTRYTTIAEFKEAMRGQILRYELETPANGGYLPMYKGRYKVSDVCQLVDKSKLPNTQTVNGITYTVDKVNGTITANGTATAESDYKTDIALNNAESYTNGGGTKIPSRLLFLGCPIGGSQTTYGLYNNWVSSGVVDIGNGGITDTTSNKYYEYYRFNLRITIKQGYTANNLIFKPQIFDLTEMYGAGNEPTTVEEFREKFPNELYPYSPYCWVNMKQMRYITTTKNLFDINQAINDTSAENAFDTFSINDNVITATSDNSTTKIVVMRLFYGELPAGDYILSLNAVIENTPKHNRPNEIFIFKNGSFLTLNNSMPTNGSYSLKIKFTLSEKAEIKITFYKSVISSQETVSDTVYKVTLSNIQLELGDTATPYVPYGYLPLK